MKNNCTSGQKREKKLRKKWIWILVVVRISCHGYPISKKKNLVKKNIFSNSTEQWKLLLKTKKRRKPCYKTKGESQSLIIIGCKKRL